MNLIKEILFTLEELLEKIFDKLLKGRKYT